VQQFISGYYQPQTNTCDLAEEKSKQKKNTNNLNKSYDPPQIAPSWNRPPYQASSLLSKNPLDA